MAFRLSEIVMDSDEIRSKILGASVVAPDGRRIGVVEDLYFARDLTIKKAVVKNDDGLSFIVPGERLVLKDGAIVLQEPPQANVHRAAREVCRALLELLEALEEEDPQETLPFLSAAREHLRNALKTLETGTSTR